MKGHDEVVKGLNVFIEHWKKIGEADVTGMYSGHYAHCVQYRSNLKDALIEPEMEGCDTLFMGFWP
jgi:hypothetical protein